MSIKQGAMGIVGGYAPLDGRLLVPTIYLPDPIQAVFGTPTHSQFEFDTTSFTGLTAMATAADSEDADTTVPGNYYVRRNGSATYRWVGRYATPPAEPFTAICKISGAYPGASFNKASLFVGVATPGNMDMLNYIYDASNTRRITLERNSQTAFSSTVASGSQIMQQIEAPIWLAIRANSSTSYDYLVSLDGYMWRALTSARNPALTIASVGLAVNPDNSTTAMTAAFDFLRIWSSAKTFLGT